MKKFEIFVKENDFEKSICKILEEIRPEWEQDEIQFKVSDEFVDFLNKKLGFLDRKEIF